MPPAARLKPLEPKVHMGGHRMMRFLHNVTIAGAAVLLAATAYAQESPTVGAAAPKFRLPDQSGKWHALDDYRGKWVVLYFYPKDNTPGCTTQACDFRDNIFAFRDAGAVILGISVDDVDSHRSFSEEYSLPFAILADSDKKVTTAYGTLTKYLGVVELARRDTFIIDPQGRVAKHYVKVDPRGHSEVVLADLRQLTTGAMPASSH